MENGMADEVGTASENKRLLEAGEPQADEFSADAKPQYKTYLGRYFVLTVAALLCTHQCIAWITFGPIPEEASEKYGLTDLEITLLPGTYVSVVRVHPAGE